MTRRLRLGPAVALVVIAGLAPLSPSHAARTEPRDGCPYDISDPAEDAQPAALVLPTKLPNDPDLDIVGVFLQTTDTDLRAIVKVKNLEKPAIGNGHLYQLAFQHGAIKIAMNGAEVDEAGNASPLGAPRAKFPYLSINGTTVAEKPTVVFDPAKDTVTFSMSLEKLAAMAKAAFPPGTVLSETAVSSTLLTVAGPGLADTAQNADAEKRKFVVGVSPCFDPVPAKLAGLAPVRVQYGDAAKVSATFSDLEDTGHAEKEITFAVDGAAPVTVLTNDDGFAEATLKTTKTAGTYAVTATYAGDEDIARTTATVAYVVISEAVKPTLSVARAGTRRTITATLKDDDGKALAAHPVTWLVNNRRVASGRTDGNGRVVLSNVAAGSTVTLDVPLVAGKYSAVKTSVRAS